jgi:(2Fe-2S) ferredoxin/ferredoxin
VFRLRNNSETAIMKLAVNDLLCDGYGKCERIASNLLKLDEDGVAQVLVHDELTPEQIEEAQAAINLCPVNAISLTDDAAIVEPVQAYVDAARGQTGEASDVIPVFQRHVFVCTSGEYCPSKDGDSKQVHKAFKELVGKAGLKGTVRINNSGCLDQCGHGPMAVVYPEGVWYSHLTLNDVPQIVAEHLVKGRPVARLRYHPPKMGKNKLARDANDCRIAGQIDGCRAEWPIIPFSEAQAGLSEDER